VSADAATATCSVDWSRWDRSRFVGRLAGFSTNHRPNPANGKNCSAAYAMAERRGGLTADASTAVDPTYLNLAGL